MKEYVANEPFQVASDKIIVRVDSIPAVLSYSADGSVWTDYVGSIDSDNVIITDIPRGAYLRFDVGVLVK